MFDITLITLDCENVTLRRARHPIRGFRLEFVLLMMPVISTSPEQLSLYNDVE